MSLRAFDKYSSSPMHLMYTFVNENVSMPNMLCDSYVTSFEMHFGRPRMFCAWQLINFLSRFLIVGGEYETM